MGHAPAPSLIKARRCRWPVALANALKLGEHLSGESTEQAPGGSCRIVGPFNVGGKVHFTRLPTEHRSGPLAGRRATSGHPHRQAAGTAFRLFRRQRLRGHADLTADGFGDLPERHAILGDSVICLALSGQLEREAVHARNVETMHGRREVPSLADPGGDAPLRERSRRARFRRLPRSPAGDPREAATGRFRSAGRGTPGRSDCCGGFRATVP